MADNCRKHKINDVNHYTHRTPDTDCACTGEGGSERGQGRGPATDGKIAASAPAPADTGGRRAGEIVAAPQ